jgi:exodeoxyribonuclease V alpha subunit
MLRQSYPRSLPAIQAYLQEHAPWVGPEISQRITAAYGEDSLEILKSDPSRAAKEINGITEDRALEISAMLKGMEEGEALELAVCDVVGNEISPRLRRKVVELWGQEAPNRIRENPYALIEALDGVGFLTADRIALKVGFDREGAPRIRAGISHALKEACWNQGHTYLPKHMLVLKAKGVLGINPEKIDAVIIQMAQEELLILRYEAAYLPDLYKDETIVAEELRRILKGKQKTDTTMVS